VPPVDSLKLNSYYVELGEISFMKEVIAYQVRVWCVFVTFVCYSTKTAKENIRVNT
jgi:hypothetical protein